MSAVLDLDQIACSGNGVVSVKPGSGEGGLLACRDTPDWAAAEGFGSDRGGSGVEVVVPSPPSADAVTASGSGDGRKAAMGSFLACLSPPDFFFFFVCRQLLACSGYFLFCSVSVCVFAGQTVSVCETARLKGVFVCVDMLEACVRF